MIRALQFLCRRCRARNEEDSDGSGSRKLRVEKDYEIGEVIGQGRLGVVHKCIHRTTGQEFACKKMPATGHAFDEILMLRNHLSGGHPGILKVMDCYWAERLGQYSWSENAYMISELCDGGDLQHFLDEHGRGILSERQRARIIKSLVQSLEYCHSKKIIHRDVKPSSIFISNSADPSSWLFKLGNFDVSICKGDQDVVYGNVGKLEYSAPEMLNGNGYSYEVDIWSAGVVLHVLLCGRTPFGAENEDAMTIYERIQNIDLDVSSGVWSSISDSAKELVLGMLEKEYTLRLSCSEILSHPWILGNAEMDVASTTSTDTADIASTSGDIASTSGVNAPPPPTQISPPPPPPNSEKLSVES